MVSAVFYSHPSGHSVIGRQNSHHRDQPGESRLGKRDEGMFPKQTSGTWMWVFRGPKPPAGPASWAGDLCSFMGPPCLEGSHTCFNALLSPSGNS